MTFSSPSTSCSGNSFRSSLSPAQQIAVFLDRLYGLREGVVYAPVGVNGHFTESGRYEHERWHKDYFDWPHDRSRLIEVALELASECDVYICPMLRESESATKGSGLGGSYCWADIDKVTKTTLALLGELLSQGSFLVRSGQRRHRHAYIHLDGVYSPVQIEELNESLALYVHADFKWAENSVLRLPGTFNHKGRGQDGDSLPVVYEDVRKSHIAPWSPQALREALGPSEPVEKLPGLSGAKGRAPGKRLGDPEPRIVAVTSKSLPHDVPRDVVQMLRGPASRPNRNSGDHTRSGQLYKFVAELMSIGYTDKGIVELALHYEPAQEKWPDAGVLEREIERCIGKLRPQHDHEGLTCADVSCRFCPSVTLAAQLDEIRTHFDTEYKAPRTQSTDSKIIDAMTKRAGEIGALELDMSQRELCRISSIGNRDTVTKGLARLEKAGYLHMLRHSNGRPIRRGKGSIATRSYRYRLSMPDGNPGPHSHSSSLLNVCGTGLSILDPSHDMWRYSGLACCRRTYAQLLVGQMTPPEIADQLGLTVGTIFRHLAALTEVGLAEKKPDGTWVAFEPDPEVVAKELGISGKGESQAQRHDSERSAYQDFRQREADEENREWDNFIREGWYPMRPGVIVPPWTKHDE